MQDYTVYKTFILKQQAEDVIAFLNDHQIDAVLGDNIPHFDVTFSGSTLLHKFEVKLKSTDFERADSFMKVMDQTDSAYVSNDYYLYQYQDPALYQILEQPDLWSDFDQELALKLLQNRGRNISRADADELKKKRIAQLAQPEKNQDFLRLIGYITSLSGGFIGAIIGYTLWTSKKTLPNGEKVHQYNELDRINGKTIFIIGCIVTVILLVTVITKGYQNAY